MSEHLILIGSFSDSLINFRGDLIRDLVATGYRVSAMAPTLSTAQRKAISDLGATPVEYKVQRNSTSILKDLETFDDLRNHFLSLKPNIVIAYTIKPVIWSGIALRAMPWVRYFPMITGLGYAFCCDSLKRRLLRSLVVRLYRKSLQRAEKVFFQNEESREVFIAARIVKEINTLVVPGSGVNVGRFAYCKMPQGDTHFLMLARLLGAKGVRAYVQAASELKRRWPAAQFRLAGPFDPSPDGISRDEMQSWLAGKAIDYLGDLSDVRTALAESNVFVLPTVYREGVPRTLLEAMATGRPLITTNSAGCRETVEVGGNGFLISPGSVSELIDRMQWCIEHREMLESMGKMSRSIAEKRFCVKLVNRMIIDAIQPGDIGNA